MTRRDPARLPGEPRSGDRDFGPLGGLADDVHFWVKDRQRQEGEQARLAREPAPGEDGIDPPGRRSRVASLARFLRRR